ncbi:catalase [Catenuloplanes nepalensis]|uniref:Catalase-related peroxidase n=1 Tax=Catenuloplanes nepalensis TaxID=587533 RepID=A0ABT9MU04_9ACTN|nr:catalase [Catenuloplanes nepalensis]MDP9794919.1 catalase [Catenuloplanes nepalensis]
MPEAERATVIRAIEAMEKHTATVPGYRRAHPRGVLFHATFTPAPDIAKLTTAEHLAGPPVTALVRLSTAPGNPHAPDRKPDGRGTTLGLGIRFDLPAGGHATWAAASIPAFPARTPKEFVQVTKLQNPATGKPSPWILAHAATHRHILPGLRAIATIPVRASFATTRYNGLHAYFLVAPDGTRRAFRYHWLPDAGEETLTDEPRPPHYLIDEILQRGTASWSLVFTLAEPGDPTDDVTAQWPDSRQTVQAGTLRLDATVEDQAALDATVFDPTGVVPGIELSDDPILHFRSQVYGESFTRRTHEERPEGY